ncbi:MAG: hypothetical protein HOP30_00270 [Cyclobacteriaceae bacterium]|nr:hypothetical protein [Cyclobacteriaceae bacterium]
MSRFELEIWDNETEKVTFYTVRWEGAPLSETDKFFAKYKETEKQAAQELLSLIIKAIGNEHGALPEFFNRPENGVAGLPPKGKIRIGEFKAHFQQFPLRLYALRINDREDLVVLFNGGLKTSEANRDSPELNLKFIEADAFGSRIEQAIREGMIVIDESSRSLKLFDGSDEIIL